MCQLLLLIADCSSEKGDSLEPIDNVDSGAFVLTKSFRPWRDSNLLPLEHAATVLHSQSAGGCGVRDVYDAAFMRAILPSPVDYIYCSWFPVHAIDQAAILRSPQCSHTDDPHTVTPQYNRRKQVLLLLKFFLIRVESLNGWFQK